MDLEFQKFLKNTSEQKQRKEEEQTPPYTNTNTRKTDETCKQAASKEKTSTHILKHNTNTRINKQTKVNGKPMVPILKWLCKVNKTKQNKQDENYPIPVGDPPRHIPCSLVKQAETKKKHGRRQAKTD